MNAHDLVQEIIERKGKIENVFWIACGGSMIDLMPANELLKREATTFTSTVYTAREFCLMAPKSLGEKSLVIACSHMNIMPLYSLLPIPALSSQGHRYLKPFGTWKAILAIQVLPT